MKPAAFAVLTVLVLAGCLGPLLGQEPTFADPLADHGFEVPAELDGPLRADQLDWPRFVDDEGRPAVLRILDHGAFSAFDEAASRFENLTGARVERVKESDTGSALNRAIQDKGDPQHDILYGVDNSLLHRAHQEGLFAPYTPRLAPRVAPDLVFFGALDPWPATPVDHGFIGLNIDHQHPALNDTPIATLHHVSANTGLFVTQDPRTSSPGLGFLLLTIDRFGEDGSYTWKHYWSELFVGPDGVNGTGDEVLVTSDWSTAYEIHFSGGYGIYVAGHKGDRPIVTSYTESPAYEFYHEPGPDGRFEGDPANLPRVLLEQRGSTYHQIQTMGVLAGTKNLAVAQAWVEFTLTDDFQELAAPKNAVYPVVPSVSTKDVYGDNHPEPGTFRTVGADWVTTGMNLERWLDEWTRLCEAHECI